VLFAPAAAIAEVPRPARDRLLPVRAKAFVLPQPSPIVRRAPVLVQPPVVRDTPSATPPIRAPEPPPVVTSPVKIERTVQTGLFASDVPLPAQPPRLAVPAGAVFESLASTASSRRGTTVSTGVFVAHPGTRPESSRAEAPRLAGFSDSSVIAASRPSAAPQPTAAATPVQIVYKPRPAYTEEARRLQIEGEVLIEAAFSAVGEVRIIRVVRGLGHGLDQAAVAAAEAIRFRPATQNGAAVDATATVRISFQLAY
jgi:TonB family protein